MLYDNLLLMSLLQKAKELAKAREIEKTNVKEENVKEESIKDEPIEEDSDDDVLEIPIIEEEFNLVKKKWVLAPNMEAIFDGNLSLIPIECVLTHYILRWGPFCYYVVLENQETGDEFEIYEFEWIGEDGQKVHGEEIDFEPEFIFHSSINAKDCGKFLVKKVSEGFQIFIEERQEYE